MLRRRPTPSVGRDLRRKAARDGRQAHVLLCRRLRRRHRRQRRLRGDQVALQEGRHRLLRLGGDPQAGRRQGQGLQDREAHAARRVDGAGRRGGDRGRLPLPPARAERRGHGGRRRRARRVDRAPRARHRPRRRQGARPAARVGRRGTHRRRRRQGRRARRPAGDPRQALGDQAHRGRLRGGRARSRRRHRAGVTDAAPAAQPDPAELLRSRRFLVLLVLAAIVGIVASLASWGFLELIHQIQVGVFYDGAPTWWPIPVLGVGALLCAAAIVFLPGTGGHIPAKGLNAGATEPRELAGVVAAALATIGLGLVLGPEAPLIALGGGLGLLGYRIAARDGPPEVGQIMAAAGTFAAVSLIFDSPLLAAVLLIEATGLGGPKLPLVLLPGLMAAGIGSLVSIGMRSFTRLSTKAYALGALTLPDFPRPDIADVGWSLLLAIAVAVVVFLVVGVARRVVPLATRRPFLVLPAAGLLIGCLAVAFGQLTDHPANEVLFSGQDDLDSLVTSASTWTVGALALLVGLKGIAWAISLGSYRGGPTFPAMFLGVAAGMI